MGTFTSAAAQAADRRRRLRRRLLAAAVVAPVGVASAVIAGATAQAGASCSAKCYSMVVTTTAGTSTVAAGSTYQFKVVLHNETSPGGQTIGSANINVPTPIVPTDKWHVTGVTRPGDEHPAESGTAGSTDQQIQLRSLNIGPGQSGTYHFTAQTPATSGTYNWTVQAKQSNDFNGTGNDVPYDVANSSTQTTVVPTTENGNDSSSWSSGTNTVNVATGGDVITCVTPNPNVALCGKAHFPGISGGSGSFLYSMNAPKNPPPSDCLVVAPLGCVFEMNMQDIPNFYTSAHGVTLTLTCDSSLCDSTSMPAGAVLFKIGADGVPVPVPTCDPLGVLQGAGELCVTQSRDGLGNLVITVFNLTAGDPRIPGTNICYGSGC